MRRHIKKGTLLLTLIICSIQQLSSQGISLSLSRGPILEIYPDFPTSKGSIRTSVTFIKKHDDSKWWNKAYRQPETAWKLSYFNFGSDILGQACGLQYQFLNKRKINSTFLFTYGLALGGIYFNSPYDYLKNDANIAVGSRFSFLPELILGLEGKINASWSASGSFNFYHTSNGHLKLPNVGINVPSYQIGINYHISERPSHEKTEIPKNLWNKKWHFNSRFSLGLNQYGGATGPTNGPVNKIYLLSVYGSKRYSAKGFYQIGIDAYYNSGYRKYISSQQIDQNSFLEDNFVDASALLVFIGHEYIYGHFGMVVQVGYNLHNPFLDYYIREDESAETSSIKAKIPGKFGVKYYLKNPFKHTGSNIYVGTFIKSNMSQADFLETGIGCRF